MAPPDTQSSSTQSTYGGSSMMKAIAEPLLELETQADMTPTRVMLVQEKADRKGVVTFLRTLEPYIKIVSVTNSGEEAFRWVRPGVS